MCVCVCVYEFLGMIVCIMRKMNRYETRMRKNNHVVVKL